MMNNNFTVLKKIKALIISFICYYSLLPYFFWSKSYVLLAFSLFLFAIQIADYQYEWNVSNYCGYKISKYYSQIAVWTLLFSYIFIFKSENLKKICGDIATLFYPIVVLLSMSDEEKEYNYNLFLNLFCITVLISIIPYFLLLMGISLPHGKLYHPSFDGYAYFENYIFFIFVYDPRSAIFPRFQSIFTEPGHLGMYCAFFLFANEYKRKDKRTWLLTLGLLFSLSLAAYALFVAGICLFAIMKKRRKAKIILSLIFFSVLTFSAAKIYYSYNQDSIFSKWVLSRVFSDDASNVKISDSLQNRSSYTFKKEYQLQKESFVDYFFGKGEKYFGEKVGAGTASGEVFIFIYGLFGVLLLIVFYFLICFKDYSGVGIGLLFFYALSFLQRPVALSFYQLFLFITLIPKFHNLYLYPNNFKRYLTI